MDYNPDAALKLRGLNRGEPEPRLGDVAVENVYSLPVVRFQPAQKVMGFLGAAGEEVEVVAADVEQPEDQLKADKSGAADHQYIHGLPRILL
ncbi:hypothetical protein KNP414_04403 [Paenibacillus mucilaginosus KNP414]|uniref:Uncharacterized protein n=1 Tax=Paenibacillus mucilaginosus (strain KNP414) TaxID=1036673 RepID=F8F6I1_PAEMK|nr:hypothetical protein KNP414_04403 [Paenibacillus mucilaginosus KNP414]